MTKKFLFSLTAGLFAFALAGVANAVVIDFSGGTALLSNGTFVTPSDTGVTYNGNVVSYVEQGVSIEFLGGNGTIGPYYENYINATPTNSVIHAHPFYSTDIRFSMVDGSAFDLNYVDMSSNTVIGGGASNGTENSYITASSGANMLLPSSDWGIDFLSNGSTPSDGVARLWLPNAFDNILSFTLSSTNAYCFGMDNFYINEEAPQPQVPEPTTMLLFGTGIAGLAAVGRRRK